MTAYLIAYGPLVLLTVGIVLLALRIRADWRENEQARELLRLIDTATRADVVSLELHRARRRRETRGGAA